MHSDRRQRLSLAGLLAASLLTVGTLANEPISFFGYYEQINSFDLDAMGYGGVQGRLVHGDPTGDQVGAMFFIVDGEVLWSPMPYSLTAVAPITSTPTPATDIAVVPAPQDDLDHLFLSTPAGLSIARYDPLDNDFDVAAFPTTTAWANATLLKQREIDGSAVLAGLDQDGSTVRVSAVDEAGETNLFSVTIPIAVLDYDLIDYDGDNSMDVAFVTPIGLYIFTQSGLLMRREAVNLQAGGAVTFDSQDGARVAFWYEDTSGRAYLTVIDGVTTEPAIALRAAAPGTQTEIDVVPSFVTVGDFDEDKNEDLFLQLHHRFGVLMINQAAPQAHFSVATGNYDSIALAPNPGLAMNPGAAYAFFGNVDSDPGDDLIVPLDQLDRIEIFTRDGLLSANGGTYELGSGSGDLVASQTTYWYDSEALPGPEARLNLALDIPTELLPTPTGQGYEYLQVVTWFQDGPSLNLTLLGKQNSLHQLQQGSPFQWIDVVPQGNGGLLHNYYWPDKHNIWVVFRFVNADVQEDPIAIEGATKFWIGAFTLVEATGDGSIPPYLTLLDGSGPPLELYTGAEPPASGTSSLPGNGYVGAWVPQSSSVLFPPGDVPQLPDAEELGPMTIY